MATKIIRLGGQFIVRNNRNVGNLEFSRCLSAVAKQPEKAAKSGSKPKETRQNKSFLTNIFRGEIVAAEAFPYPYAITEEELENVGMFVDPVTKFFTEQNNPGKNDDTSTIDKETLDALWALGAFAFQVPQEYGGNGCNNTQYARMTEIIGAHDLGVGICLGAHQSIGFKGILLVGTPEQKAKYLPQVSTGKVFAAFCLTEPTSGSDANSIRCKAVKSADGKHYILNGSKIWISNGGIADIMTVFAQTEVDDPKTGEKKNKVTAFIVERGFGGVTNGPPERKMGIKCSNTTEVYYDNVKIPVENVLGQEGEGFKVAMAILNNGRFGMAGTMGGTMAACIKKAAEHAATRVQFGKTLQEYGSIQEKLARMATLQYVTQSMAYMISGNMDSGSEDYHLEAAISKVFGSEAAWYVCDESIQILGGMGFMKDTGLERVMRDLRIFRIFEGTNDILRLFVALSGIQYAGSHLKELQKAFSNPAANLGLIIKEVSNRAIKKVGMGGSDLSPHVHPSLRDSAKLTSESIDVFGAAVESLLVKYGKNIVNQQCELTRLADCAIDIYASTVALSRCSRSLSRGEPTAELERLMTESWCIEAHDRVKVNNNKISSPLFGKLYANQSKISKAICENQGVVTTNPLNV